MPNIEPEYDPCVWIDSEMYWSTSCGKVFNIIDGTPSENGFKFCVYCGKMIQEELFITEEMYKGFGFGNGGVW